MTGTLPNPVLASIVTAGSAAKITYDAKGRVTAGTTLVAADIPNISTTVLTAGTLPIARGGTGAATMTANALIMSDGTGSALSALPKRIPAGVMRQTARL